MDPTAETQADADYYDAGASLERGDEVHRYVVVEKVGAGSMGVVYGAFDPELGRKVALKLVLPQPGGSSGSGDGGGLLREAQALAQLSHPNVVVVHDVGEHRGQVFLAMEFVVGKTLTEFLRDAPKWPEVLRLFRQAGQGLAAAHAAGVVHRDFKPDNIMVASDGRVRVMDFGLARAGRVAPDETPGPDAEPLTDATGVGELVGTPAYMAPEQFAGAKADALSDQFAFCVALHEALYGVRPFRGETFSELALSVTTGKVRPPPSDRPVPQATRRIVLKGLSGAPTERFESMESLLAALAHDPSAARKRWAAVGALALVGGGLALADQLVERRAAAQCEAAAAEIAALWNTEAQDRVAASFASTGARFAHDAARRVTEALDAYAGDWADDRIRACREQQDAPQGEEAALTVACLDGAKLDVAALLDVWADSTAETVRTSIAAASALVPVARCRDVVWMRAHRVAAPEHELAEPLKRLFAQANAMRAAGRFPEALEAMQAALAMADEAEDPAAKARATVELGRAYRGLGHYLEAEHSLEAGYHMATVVGDDLRAARAATALADVVGVLLVRPDAARAWTMHAQTMLARAGETDALVRAELLQNEALLAHAVGDNDAAVELGLEALARYEADLGANHPALGGPLNNLGLVYQATGRFDEALHVYQRVQELWRGTVGEDHPDIALPLINIGTLQLRQADYAAARTSYEDALALVRRTVGERHQFAAKALNNLGALEKLLGRNAEALARYEEALAVMSDYFPPTHPQYGIAQANVGHVLSELGRHEEGAKHLATALRNLELSLGASHPDVANTVNLLGTAQLERGEFDDALASFERALAAEVERSRANTVTAGFMHNNIGDALRGLRRLDEAGARYELSLVILEESLGSDSAYLAHPLTGLGRVLLEQGRPAAARPLLERALALRQRGQENAALVSETQFALARALARTDARRARSLARDAHTALDELGPSHAEQALAIGTWLSSQPAAGG